ncbi:MAG: deoxyribonuclease IV [Treponema sp.]|nr:deoxyribonuclease IV [Treponema sp.]
MIFIGNHLSSSNGYLAMGKAATQLGGTTFAFFTRNPRGGAAKDIDPADAKALNDYLKENGFGKLVAHAPYTMNLCSDKMDIRKFALDMLKDDLQRMEATPNQYYNFHPGSHVGQGVEVTIPVIAEALNMAMFDGMTTTVLLETMAGKGTEVGRSFEEIKQIIDLVKDKDHIGVCLDTCHVWDGGYDIVSDFDKVLDEFDKVIGLEKLKAIHINDSMNVLGAHKDRHEKIGLGHIGDEAFKKIVTNKRVQNLPFILETPNDDKGYAEEIAKIKSWMI